MRWEVQIEGDESEIERFAEYFTDENSESGYFKKNEPGYVLCFLDPHEKETAKSIKIRAERVLTFLAGATRLLGKHVEFRAGSACKVTKEGKHHTVTFVERISFSIKEFPVGFTLRRADGSVIVQRANEVLPQYIHAANADEDVATVLRLRNHDNLSWSSLYKIAELIGFRAIVQKGWVNNAEINNFKHTANNLEVAGDEARHGKKTGEPPKNPMSKKEGRDLVDKIIKEWINEKLKNM